MQLTTTVSVSTSVRLISDYFRFFLSLFFPGDVFDSLFSRYSLSLPPPSLSPTRLNCNFLRHDPTSFVFLLVFSFLFLSFYFFFGFVLFSFFFFRRVTEKTLKAPKRGFVSTIKLYNIVYVYIRCLTFLRLHHQKNNISSVFFLLLRPLFFFFFFSCFS